MLSGNEWKQIENVLRDREVVKLPSIRTVTPNKPDSNSKKSQISGSRRNKSQRASSEIAEEVARNRHGLSIDGVPTLGIFKSSFLKTFSKNPEIQIENNSSLTGINPGLLFSSSKNSPNYTSDPQPPSKSYKEYPKYLGISERHLPLDLFVEETITCSELIKEAFENSDKRCFGKTRFEYSNGKIE